MATLDAYTGGVYTISGGGLVATPITGGGIVRTSLGRTTGKRIWAAWLTTQPPEGEIYNGFGFCTAEAPLSGNVTSPGFPGFTPANAGVTIIPINRFIFSNATLRGFNGIAPIYISTYPRGVAFALDLDAQKWWFCLFDPDTMISPTGWCYDDAVADGISGPPVSDPTLATGRSYASYVNTSATIYPFMAFGTMGYSGQIDFTGAASPCPIPDGWTGWAQNGDGVFGDLSASDPIETLSGAGSVVTPNYPRSRVSWL